MKFNNIAIIGAGQLGSRHLQGVLSYKQSLAIYVVDPSDDALEIAKNRALEIENTHKVSYVNKIEGLPKELELVIIATNSNVRAQVISNLLSITKVNYLILEKVLFQSIADYELIHQLLIKHSVKTWVNHPRREQVLYQNIKDKLRKDERGALSFNVYGQNWGLGCNGLHLLDLLTYLTDDDILELSTSELDLTIIESKRKGFVEFSGAITGKLMSGVQFRINSVSNADESVLPITVTIFTPNQRFIVQEAAISTISLFDKANNYKLEVTESKLLFQSDLTTIIVQNLLSKGTCNLPTYEAASKTHKVFIKAMLSFYNKQTNKSVLECPIT